jgi:hypothetical protein
MDRVVAIVVRPSGRNLGAGTGNDSDWPAQTALVPEFAISLPAMLRCRLVSAALALTVLVSSQCALAEFNAGNPVYSLPYNDPKWTVLWTALGVAGSLLLTRAEPPGPAWATRGHGFVTSSTTWLHSIHSDRTDVWGAQLMYGRYARTWLSLGIEGSALGLRDARIRTGAASGSLLAHWHLLTERSASLFFESGVGLVYFGSAFHPAARS